MRHACRPPGLFNAILFLLTFSPQFSPCFAQGSLTPPGAPAPTMKSLDQISQQITNVSLTLTTISNQVRALSEPRYPIYTFQTNLTIPGSYGTLYS